MPWFSTNCTDSPLSTEAAVRNPGIMADFFLFQAGLLTSGSFYLLRLPIYLWQTVAWSYLEKSYFRLILNEISIFKAPV